MTVKNTCVFFRWSPVAALMLVSLTLSLAVQAQDSSAGIPSTAAAIFRREPTPNPGFNNLLRAISGDSEHDIWAVGTLASGALGLHFDGLSWKAVPMALPTTADMAGVSVLSSTDVWAVGSVFTSGAQHFTSVIQHFDGTKWSVFPSPHFASGDQLFGVKAISSNDVFAVGELHSDTLQPLPLVEHFDGTLWSVVPVPLVTGQTVSLHAIAATSHSDVWVTGFGPASQPPTIMHFDGLRFSNVPFPLTSAVLSGVTAISPTDAWVVGGRAQGSLGIPLTAHWNGATWREVLAPGETASSLLGAVTAISTSDVWAVGCVSCGANTAVGQTILIEHWDGTKWSINPTPLIGQGDKPGSVIGFPSGSVYVAGFSAGPQLPTQTLILHTSQGQ